MKQPWLPRAMRRKGRKPKSQTAGKDKGWNCQREPNSSAMAKRNRSYKSRDYPEWSAKHRGDKEQYRDQRGNKWSYE